MKILLNESDLSKLKAATKEDLLTLLLKPELPDIPNETESFDWNGRVDLTPDQIKAFIEGCAEKTVAGLKIIAEEGPVIWADLLEKAEIDNYGHFQGSTTKRVRTVTGKKDAYLLAWDDWASEENQQYGCGRYAITRKTHWSLCEYFGV